jgi:hypothetical protein
LRKLNPEALLVVGLDAADNSCDYARQRGETGIVKHILNLPFEGNIRIVLTARTGRLELLGDTDAFEYWPAPAFSNDETREHVQATFPDAGDEYLKLFQARTAGNPRVQAFALRIARTRGDPLVVWEILDGQPPRDPQEALDRLFWTIIEQAISRNGDEYRVAAMLHVVTLLPHPIPHEDLATAAGTSFHVVQDLLVDLETMITNETGGIVFGDEPSKTYIRSRFKNIEIDQQALIARLKHRSNESFYAYITVQRLLISAKQRRRVSCNRTRCISASCLGNE